MKKNWKLLGDLMGRNTTSFHQSFVVDGRETDDPERIAQMFNNYFISYPKTVQEGIPNSNYDFSDLIPRNPNTMFLFESTKEEVMSVIKRIDKNGNLHDISDWPLITYHPYSAICSTFALKNELILTF